MSIYDNIAYGPRTHGIRSKVKLDEIVEKALRDAAIWDEVKDRLKTVSYTHLDVYKRQKGGSLCNGVYYGGALPCFGQLCLSAELF